MFLFGGISAELLWKFSEDKTNIILHILKDFLKIAHWVRSLYYGARI